MFTSLPPVNFYIPKAYFPQRELPEDPDNYWAWQVSVGTKDLGFYAWTLQTYLYLKASGFPCQLVSELPSQGIVISHRHFLRDDLKPSSKLLIVCLQSDRSRHPYAQIHIVQNPTQQVTKQPFTFWESYYIPHWPQPGLIPRRPERGDKLENVAFFGGKHNLVNELRQPSWPKLLAESGLKWHLLEKTEFWHDYGEVDLVVAIRNFGYNWDHTWKPATKLYNAWHAGVPAILGRESAYQAEYKSKLDYMEVDSFQSLLDAIKKLRDSKELRRKMVENGRVRAQETERENIVNAWCNLITDIAAPAYSSWCKASAKERARFFLSRQLLFPFYYSQRRFRLLSVKATTKLRGKELVGQRDL